MRLNILSTVEYAVFPAASIILLVFFHNYYMFFLLVFLTVLPAVSIMTQCYIKNHLHCTLELQKRSVHIGEQDVISITIQNPTWFPLLNCNAVLRIQNHFYPEAETVQIPVPALAKQSNTVCFPLQSLYSGSIEVQLLHIQLYDMLHLLMLNKKFSTLCTAIVKPENEPVSIPVTDCRLKDSSDATPDQPWKGTSENMMDVRSYRPGDRLQHIHWKLSAKKAELLVKEFESEAGNAVCVLFELNYDYNLNYNLNPVLNQLNSICLQTLETGTKLWLNWWSEDEQEIQSRCIAEQADMEPFWCDLFAEQSYESAYLARQNFRPVSAGFTDFYYLYNREGGAVLELEQA